MSQRSRSLRSVSITLTGAAALATSILAPAAHAQSAAAIADVVDQRLDLAQTAIAACDASQAAQPRPTEPLRLEVAYSGRRVSVSAIGTSAAPGWRRCVEEAVLAAVPVGALEAAGVPRQPGTVTVSVALGAPSVTTQPAAQPPYAVGQRVTVQWGASWYPATVVRVESMSSFMIRYEGWSSDEVVGLDRIRIRDGETAPPAPQPTVTPGTPARFTVERPAVVTPQIVVVTPPQVVVTPPPAVVNLVVNGNFESPQVPTGNIAITPALPGWRVVGSSGAEVQANVAGAPAEGRQHVELDGDRPTSIAQDIPTRPGQRYELSLSFAARPGSTRASNRLLIVWGGQVVARVDADGTGQTRTNWVTVTQFVTATGRRTTLELRDEGTADTLGTYVDDVRVIVSP